MNDTGATATTNAAGSGLPAPATMAHRHAARAAADRHSRRVRAFKIALPVFGIAALALIGALTWVKMHFMSGIDMKKVLYTDKGLTMVEPRLSGRSEGRTYDVSAAKAFQKVDNPKIINLEGIDGRLEMADGVSARIVAGKGLYDGTREDLSLEGEVAVTASNGWKAKAGSAAIDLNVGGIRASGSVRIDGPTATIESDTLDLTESGHHAVFAGNVRMTIQFGGEPAEADRTATSATR